MKIILEANEFTESVAWVTKNYDAKDDGAYVGFVMDENGTGFFTHLSETAYRKAPLTASSVELDKDTSVSLALDGKYLQRLSATLGKTLGTIELRSTGDTVQNLQVVSTFGEFTVPVYLKKLGEVPTVVKLGEVSETDFLDGMQRVAKLSDNDASSNTPVITAIDVRLKPEDSRVSIMGTDRFALGEMEFNYTPAEGDDVEGILAIEDGVSRSFMIPATVAATVAPAKGSSELVDFVYDTENEKVGYSFADGRIALFSMIAGTPLKYTDMLNSAKKAVDNSLIINLNSLKKSVAAVSSLVWDETHIWLDIDAKDKTLIAADGHNKNTITTEVDELEADENIRIKFHRMTLGKSLNSLASTQVKIQWSSGEGTPIFIVQPVVAENEVDQSTTVLVQPQKND